MNPEHAEGPRGRTIGILSLAVSATVIALAAGSPLGIPVAGRTLSLGPSNFLILAILLSTPFWMRGLPKLDAFTACATLFVAWAWASAVFWSVDYRRSVIMAETLLEAGIVFIAAWHVVRDRGSAGLSNALRLFNVIIVAQIVWVLARIAAGGAYGYFSLKSGLQLPLGASNFLAVFLEFGLLYELMARRKGWPVFAAANGIGILLTFSRGALVATGTMLLLCAVLLLFIRGQRRFSALAIGALCIGVMVILFGPASVVVEAMSAIQRTAGARFGLWREAWEEAAWRPLTGVGYGAYESLGSDRDAHSIFFGLLAETGLVGVALFFGAMLTACGQALVAAIGTREIRPEALGIAAGLGVTLVHSLFEPFYVGAAAIWSAVILAWISARWSDRRDVVGGRGHQQAAPTQP